MATFDAYVPIALHGPTGAAAATRYAGGTTSGAPASGTFSKGDFVIDQTGTIWVCTVAGSPGTWVSPTGSGGPPSGSAGGVLAGTYPNPDLATSVAGNGLGIAANILAVNVDNSTIDIAADTVEVKSGGITDTQLNTSGASAGTYGDSTHVAQVTVTNKGRVTGVTAVAISGAGTSTPDTGWIDDSADTWTYASGSGGGTATFTVTGDRTVALSTGTRIQLTQTTVKYFVVQSSTFGAGTTTVTITGGSDYTLANAAISANAHSYMANPQGFPGWFNFATAASGFSSISTNVGKFAVDGRTMHIYFDVQGTSNATTLGITLPIPNQNSDGGIFIGGWIKNSGTVAGPGRMDTGFNSAALSCTRDTNGTAWTNSGAKAFIASIDVQI